MHRPTLQSVVTVAARTAAGLLLLGGLGGCRSGETNRPTAFTPGVYKGDPMPTLNAAQVEDLKKRGQLLR